MSGKFSSVLPVNPDGVPIPPTPIVSVIEGISVVSRGIPSLATLIVKIHTAEIGIFVERVASLPQPMVNIANIASRDPLDDVWRSFGVAPVITITDLLSVLAYVEPFGLRVEARRAARTSLPDTHRGVGASTRTRTSVSGNNAHELAGATRMTKTLPLHTVRGIPFRR